ncbi:MAG: CRISPR-associated helicase Cas3' [Cyanobacteria bacterium P01_E01_bin.42]
MRLLAKSIHSEHTEQDKEALTLPGHLKLGIEAVLSFQTIAREIVRAIALEMTPEKLIDTVAFAIWLHDIGKANEDFQAMVQEPSYRYHRDRLRQWYGINQPVANGRRKQLIRHEVLSAVLLREKRFWEWLQPAKTRVSSSAALLAIVGHHLKVEDNNALIVKVGDLEDLEVFTTRNDFEQCLQLGCRYFNLSTTLPHLRDRSGRNNSNYSGAILQEKTQKFADYCHKIDESIQDNFEKRKTIATIKVLTMAADLAASALFETERGDRNYNQWITEALQQRMSARELQQVIDARLKGKKRRDFQTKAIAKQARVLIVIAGCGAGKSLIPFGVFERKTREEGLNAKVFFCYPTTATTSQGFEDYAAPTEIENTLLMHSRARVDEQLKGLLDFYDDDEEDAKQKEANFVTRVEALKLWHSKLIYCTAHTVLGLIQNHRKGVYGFPAIACGAFVFDEIHAYPRDLFGALLHFLRVFRNVPIILMSASMTQQQQEAIQAVLGETGEEAEIVPGPVEIEELDRYRIVSLFDRQDWQDVVWEEAIAELQRGGKVLWITNQVADAQTLYGEAIGRFRGVCDRCLLYHSRFRYEDSVDRQKELIKAFRDEGAAFAVTTQIAEMSLDISATLLISANAPIWALIQRLGRLNRWIDEVEQDYRLKTGRICKAIVYPWEDKYPYEKEDLETGRNLVETLNGCDVNQSRLAEEMEKVSFSVPDFTESEWLRVDRAKPGSLMAPGYTIQVILKDDVAKIKAKPKKQWAIEAGKLAVSVRIPNNVNQWERDRSFKYYRIAPKADIHYHPEIGAYEPQKHPFLTQRYGHDTKRKTPAIA